MTDGNREYPAISGDVMAPHLTRGGDATFTNGANEPPRFTRFTSPFQNSGPLIEDIPLAAPPSRTTNTPPFPPLDVIGDLHTPQRAAEVAHAFSALAPRPTVAPMPARAARTAGPMPAPGAAPKRPPFAPTNTPPYAPLNSGRLAQPWTGRPAAAYTAPLTQARGTRWQALLVLLGGALVVASYFLPWRAVDGSQSVLTTFQDPFPPLFKLDVLLGFLAACLLTIVGLGNLVRGFTPDRLRYSLTITGASYLLYLPIEGSHVVGVWLALLGGLLPFAAPFFDYRAPTLSGAKKLAPSPLHGSMRFFLASALLATLALGFFWLSTGFRPVSFVVYIFDLTHPSAVVIHHLLNGRNLIWAILLMTPFIALIGSARFLARYTGLAPLRSGQGNRAVARMATTTGCQLAGLILFRLVYHDVATGGFGPGWWLTVIAFIGMVIATISAIVALRRARLA